MVSSTVTLSDLYEARKDQFAQQETVDFSRAVQPLWDHIATVFGHPDIVGELSFVGDYKRLSNYTGGTLMETHVFKFLFMSGSVELTARVHFTRVIAPVGKNREDTTIRELEPACTLAQSGLNTINSLSDLRI